MLDADALELVDEQQSQMKDDGFRQKERQRVCENTDSLKTCSR